MNHEKINQTISKNASFEASSIFSVCAGGFSSIMFKLRVKSGGKRKVFFPVIAQVSEDLEIELPKSFALDAEAFLSSLNEEDKSEFFKSLDQHLKVVVSENASFERRAGSVVC